MEQLKRKNITTLSTNPTEQDLTKLNLGQIVYLKGLIYTAREGVYKKDIEEDENIPINLIFAQKSKPTCKLNKLSVFTIGNMYIVF